LLRSNLRVAREQRRLNGENLEFISEGSRTGKALVQAISFDNKAPGG